MINGLEGIPGSGKSYEAVAFHVLDGLKNGRRIITNLPLVVDLFNAISPGYGALIEVRKRPALIRGTWDADRVREDEHGNTTGEAFQLFEDGHTENSGSGVTVFGHVWDYYSTWKDAKGRGPLYIIDECHNPLPTTGTDQQVIEWFKLHRHYNADVLLMTQSFRDMNQPIARLLAMLIKCRKADILGRKDSYIRKVQAGYRGATISQEERKYEPQYFQLYKSHTQGNSVSELGATDVAPFIVKFRRYTAIVLILGMIGVVYALYQWASGPSLAEKAAAKRKQQAATTGGKIPEWAEKAGVKPHAQAVATAPAIVAPSAAQSASSPASGSIANRPAEPKTIEDEFPDPYAAKGLHIAGRLSSSRGQTIVLSVSQNGVYQNTVTTTDLAKVGFKYHHQTDCAGVLQWRDKLRAVICDSPMAGMSPGVGTNSGAPVTASYTAPAPQDGPKNFTPEQVQVPPSTTKQDGAVIKDMRTSNRGVSN